MHTYIHTFIHTYVRAYIHAYIHTYIHTYIISRVCHTFQLAVDYWLHYGYTNESVPDEVKFFKNEIGLHRLSRFNLAKKKGDCFLLLLLLLFCFVFVFCCCFFLITIYCYYFFKHNNSFQISINKQNRDVFRKYTFLEALTLVCKRLLK